MKRSFFAVLAVMLSVSLWGRTPERRVMYTLPPGEVLDIGEYIVQYSLSGSKFALITYNPQTKKSTLVFNGKPIVASEKYLGDIYTLGYINVDEPDGYVVKVWDGKDYYVNRGGKMEGPYEYVFWDYPEDYEYQYRYGPEPPEMTDTYYYVLANRVYKNVGGKLMKSEGARFVGDICDDEYYYVDMDGHLLSYPKYGSFYSDGRSFAYVYKMMSYDDYYFLVINGYETDRARNFGDVVFNEKGDYAYSRCELNSEGYDEWYVVKNGEKLTEKGYSISDLRLLENGDVVYVTDNRIHLPKETIVVDSGYVDQFVYIDREHYGFTYRKNTKMYVRVNGASDLGPYDRVEWFTMKQDGTYSFVYGEGTKKYVRHGNKIYGPFRWVDNVKFLDNGGCSFTYSKGGDSYWYNNGKIVNYNTYWDSLVLDNNGHNFYSNCEYNYVVIDGERFGNSAALQARYDEAKNAFVWLSLEGQELVVYEYRLD